MTHSQEQGGAGEMDAARLDLARIRVVLVETSHVGNIGSTARAMRTMGLSRLVLVNPRDAQFAQHPDAIALAAGAQALLQSASVTDTLRAALAGVAWAVATTGYAREFGPQTSDVRTLAAQAAQRLQQSPGDIAIVFGPERTGLSNEHVLACQAGCSIPTDPLHGSLNLSHAVQVVGYEWRRAVLEAHGQADAVLPRRDSRHPQARDTDPAASLEATEAMFDHWEQALAAIGYLDPQQPKHLMARIRRLLGRAEPTGTEIDILRGIAAAMIRPRHERIGQKQSAKGSSAG